MIRPAVKILSSPRGPQGVAGGIQGPNPSVVDNFPTFKDITGAELKDSGISFIDEDSMTTNSAVKVPSQQSVKAYVDASPVPVKATKAEVATGTNDAKFNTPLSIAELMKPEEGKMYNGRILPSVASNNLTVALKTLAGADPSVTDPVYVMIGGVLRSITSALSVTKNAATNWMNLGSAELATKETDLFVYLGYNATDGVVIGFSRIPFANRYDEFSATTTNEKYAGISTITTAAAGDSYVNIGRFAATLSAGAGYTWSVPTFTASNLIQKPIYETRRLVYLPTYTGFSSAPASAVYAQLVGRNMKVTVGDSSGTSNATGFTMTVPFTCSAGLSSGQIDVRGNAYDNGSWQTAPANVSLSDNSNLITIYKTTHGVVNWTNSGIKTCYFSIEYPI